MTGVEPRDLGDDGLPRPTGGGPLELGPEFDRQFQLVVGRAYVIAGYAVEPDVADDVAQEVGVAFWKAWLAKPGGFSNAYALERWIGKAVRTHLMDRVRAKAREQDRDLEHEERRYKGSRAWANPDTALEIREGEAVVAAATASLPKGRREVHLRVRDDGASYAEVGAERGISVDAVKYHVVAAHTALGNALRPYLGYDPAAKRDNKEAE